MHSRTHTCVLQINTHTAVPAARCAGARPPVAGAPRPAGCDKGGAVPGSGCQDTAPPWQEQPGRGAPDPALASPGLRAPPAGRRRRLEAELILTRERRWVWRCGGLPGGCGVPALSDSASGTSERSGLGHRDPPDSEASLGPRAGAQWALGPARSFPIASRKPRGLQPAHGTAGCGRPRRFRDPALHARPVGLTPESSASGRGVLSPVS